MDETAIGKPQIVLPLRHLRFENKLPLNLIKVKRFCILEGAAKECILEGAAKECILEGAAKECILKE